MCKAKVHSPMAVQHQSKLTRGARVRNRLPLPLLKTCSSMKLVWRCRMIPLWWIWWQQQQIGIFFPLCWHSGTSGNYLENKNWSFSLEEQWQQGWMQLQNWEKDFTTLWYLPTDFIYCILEPARLDGGLPHRLHVGTSQHPRRTIEMKNATGNVKTHKSPNINLIFTAIKHQQIRKGVSPKQVQTSPGSLCHWCTRAMCLVVSEYVLQFLRFWQWFPVPYWLSWITLKWAVGKNLQEVR